MPSKCKSVLPTSIGDDQAGRLAFQLKALAHPARIGIIHQLQKSGCCCCGDICAGLPLAQSTISQHLDLLCNAGLVDYQPEGNRSRYRLNRESFKALVIALGEVVGANTAINKPVP